MVDILVRFVPEIEGTVPLISDLLAMVCILDFPQARARATGTGNRNSFHHPGNIGD